MSRLSDDAQIVVSLLFSLPILAVWAFALYDIVRRPDLKVIRKVVYSVVVVLVFPATLLYLLSRPTSIVRHRERQREDWREDLVDHLSARPGAPPVLGRRQEQLLLDRVEQLRS